MCSLCACKCECDVCVCVCVCARAHRRMQGVGALETCPPLVQFLSFSPSFQHKSRQIIGFCQKPRDWQSLSGKSWIHHWINLIISVITTSKRSCGKVMFSRVPVNLFRGVFCPWDVPLELYPRDRTPLGTVAPGPYPIRNHKSGRFLLERFLVFTDLFFSKNVRDSDR